MLYLCLFGYYFIGQAQSREFDDWAGPVGSNSTASDWPSTDKDYRALVLKSIYF